MISLQGDCDSTSLRESLKTQLNKVNDQLQTMIDSLDDERKCLLSEFETVRAAFIQAESKAALYYLNCYLSPYTDCYDELSRFIQSMSARRHGALIAVERNEPLLPLLHNGTIIGAKVSHYLLESIFYPGNPLHDGAVLIRSNEIVSAKNILPVSDSSKLSESYGTRHRAAIGLSETSDAIVLVVSEETGHASFAIEGQLYPLAVSHP
ncbi:sporulation-specific diadenylate cyclase CdaS [Paenibacillus sp. GCM10012307]|uniref:Diadenylate cyclase n=1 Tax=Paenibacillus roseus TaxID=2798579 RepID=A0A934J4Q2_9BACL|nr:sporulation-specific diadenylate cyclase CdaS [Paenibacillus roseus]MBJ6360298.1 DNA integrity scanning protein DisA nucleotide-binding domain protein [Paenibacillus roseus]